MIELPEALVIARQMNEAIAGKTIASAMRGNAPHKFAFYTRSAEEYAEILKDRRIGRRARHGGLILIPAEPDYLVALGGGGERISLHRDAKTLPKKHQLLLHFSDGRVSDGHRAGLGRGDAVPRLGGPRPSLGRQAGDLSVERCLH